MIVSEVHLDPSGSDQGREWFELHNATGADIDLDGWSVNNLTGGVSISSSLVIGAGGYVVLGVGTDPVVNGDTPVDLDYGPSISLENVDSLTVVAPDTSTTDVVAWGPSWTLVEGAALSLDPGSLDGVDNDDPANWCASTAPPWGSFPDSGTPGAANPTCPSGDDDDAADDDDATADDDDATADDDDVAPDDDDSALQDDDDSAAGPPCGTDGLEPNDVPADAYLTFPNTYPDLMACAADDDWVTFDLVDGEGVTVTLTFDHAEGDINVELLDAGLTVLASATSTTDDEAVDFVVGTSGTYYARVWLENDTGSMQGNLYDFDLLIGPGCPMDVFDPNDEGSPARIPGGEFEQLRLCPADTLDVYDLGTLPGGTGIDVEVSFTHAEGDIAISLRDQFGVVASSQSVTDNESVSVTACCDGDYELQVELLVDTGSIVGNGYDIQLELDVPEPCAYPDAYEDSDSSAEAHASLDQIVNGLGVCPGDDDWFAVAMEPGMHLDFTALFTHAEGNINVYLLDQNLSPIQSATSSSDDESISYTASTPGVRYLRITLAQDLGSVTGNAYGLDYLAE